MIITDAAALGAFIRETRKKLGVTQRDLATASGTGLRFIIELEAGKETCRIGLALNVMQTLGIETRCAAAYSADDTDGEGDA